VPFDSVDKLTLFIDVRLQNLKVPVALTASLELSSGGTKREAELCTTEPAVYRKWWLDKEGIEAVT
jgi:hypothetical protein